MFSIETRLPPQGTWLASHQQFGNFVDCYCVRIPKTITLQQYLSEFYRTPLFKLERLILAWTVGKPSSDSEVIELSNGSVTKFAAWEVESRNEQEILLRDYSGNTKSWLMIEPAETENLQETILYFGSVVVAKKNHQTGKPTLGKIFHLLLGFHKLYSKLLLSSAAFKLKALNHKEV